KERKKAEKQKKFDEKKATTADGLTTAATSKTKEKKTKQDAEEEAALPKYVEETAFRPEEEYVEHLSGSAIRFGLTGAALKPLGDPYVKAYVPGVVESAWYAWWEKKGYFTPKFGPDNKVNKKSYFVISTPPPGDDSDGERWVTGRTREAAEEKAKARFLGKKLL
ncbi:MAG: hypothetical protein Q9214_004567, partial [Letrouitia sp. 1 TL-2023]